jgi:hypothetical protein
MSEIEYDHDNLPAQAASYVAVETDSTTARLVPFYERPGWAGSARPLAAFSMPREAAEQLHADLGAELADERRTDGAEVVAELRLRSRQRGWALVLAEALQDVIDGTRVDAAAAALSAYRMLFGQTEDYKPSGPLAAEYDLRGWEDELAGRLEALLDARASRSADELYCLAEAERRLDTYRQQAAFTFPDPE